MVFDGLFSDLAPPRIHCGVILAGRIGLQHAAGPELLVECLILGILGVFWFLFRVQVIQIPVELIEAVHGGQELISIPEVVLPDLGRRIPVILEHLGNGHIGIPDPFFGPGHPDGEHPGPERMLPHDKRGASRRAALLCIGIRHQGSFFGDPVDVRRHGLYHTHVVGADIVDAQVISPNHQDIGLILAGSHRRHGQEQV